MNREPINVEPLMIESQLVQHVSFEYEYRAAP